MREDDYTGSPLDADDDTGLLPADVDLYEFDPDEEALAEELTALEENEQVIRIGAAAEGAKTLQDAASALYDFADDLVAMSEEGWELVDNIAGGQGTAVQFAAIEGEDP